jgi:hypothetical protein
VVTHEDGTRSRGSTWATVRTRRDRAGLRPHVALSALQGPERAWCRPVLAEAPVVRAGARLRDERGVLDGATVSHVQRQRQGEVLIPLTAPLLATPEARPRAARADTWAAHPARAAPRMAWGHGVAPRGPEGAVPLTAGGMRCGHTKKTWTDPLVVVTTALTRNAPWRVRHDDERPEIAQDDEQRHRGGWQLQKRRATRARAIVFSVLTVVLRDSRSPLCANTKRGARWADKTRQALACEPRRPQRTPVMVDAGGHCARFETWRCVQMVLQWSPPVQER